MEIASLCLACGDDSDPGLECPENELRETVLEGSSGSDAFNFLLASISICRCSGLTIDGAGREAARVDEFFPLWMTYTAQKSGTPLRTFAGMSFALNLKIPPFAVAPRTKTSIADCFMNSVIAVITSVSSKP